jgi:predicted site-specific integrase-resolvase
MLEKEKPVKITHAASELGISYKTAYNWIQLGYLTIVHPGYIHMSELRRAQIRVQNIKTDNSKKTTNLILRDQRGRFTSKDK